MAPDETSTTSVPLACASASASTIGWILPEFSPLIEDEPTLTTMRRAVGMSSRLKRGHAFSSSPGPICEDFAAIRSDSSSARASALASMLA